MIETVIILPPLFCLWRSAIVALLNHWVSSHSADDNNNQSQSDGSPMPVATATGKRTTPQFKVQEGR